MNIDDFIKERATPYSKIKDVKINKDDTVSYTEVYNLTHPMCPFVNVDNASKALKLNDADPNKIKETKYKSWRKCNGASKNIR